MGFGGCVEGIKAGMHGISPSTAIGVSTKAAMEAKDKECKKKREVETWHIRNLYIYIYFCRKP